MRTIKLNAGVKRDSLKNLGLRLLGSDRVEHFKFVIGNYWEERKTGLDTDILFMEMVRLFKKKKLVKKMINEGREQAIRYLIDQDINLILNRWCRQVYYVLSRGDDGNLLDQKLTCEKASIVIEEDSTCQVIFKGQEYECLVEGRRAIVGLVKNEYQTTRVDKDAGTVTDFLRGGSYGYTTILLVKLFGGLWADLVVRRLSYLKKILWTR